MYLSLKLSPAHCPRAFTMIFMRMCRFVYSIAPDSRVRSRGRGGSSSRLIEFAMFVLCPLLELPVPPRGVYGCKGGQPTASPHTQAACI